MIGLVNGKIKYILFVEVIIKFKNLDNDLVWMVEILVF